MTYRNPPPLTWHANRLQGRVTLVTGASSGIGAAAARLFAKEGAKVVLAARREDRIGEIADELKREGHEAIAVACDITDEASVARTVDMAVKTYGGLHAALNNAGVGGVYGQIHELKLADYDRIMETNLRGAFICIQQEARIMTGNTDGGAIVNMSSLGGLIGTPGSPIYSISKWGLTGLTKAAALQYAAQNIRVNAVAPAATESEILARICPTEEARARIAAVSPMNYIAHPDDIARAALFLLSDESRWTTGLIFPCDGGASAGQNPAQFRPQEYAKK